MTEEPKLHYCWVQINPDQICEGYYRVMDGFVVMHHANGRPVFLTEDAPFPVREKISPDSNPNQLARRLTRHIRKVALGPDNVSGFWSRIDYTGGAQIGEGNTLKYRKDGSIV